MKEEVIVLGGGCFWCTEAIFKMLKGVTSVVSGYAGGQGPNPTYEQVSTGETGYAEVIRLGYDSTLISLADLLTVFFATHDGSTLNCQGADVGTQYRSVIFYTTPAQQSAAEQFIGELNNSNLHGAPIITEVQPLINFYPAETYQQNYYEGHKQTGYCELVINPKLEKVQKQFANLLKQHGN